MTPLRRLIRHGLVTHRYVSRCFPPECLAAIQSAISHAETQHSGEIRFAVEAGLEPRQLLHGITPQQRALEVFSNLRVWDTEHNNGVLIYVLLAEHAVEIVADRGIHAKVGNQRWEEICQAMERAFKHKAYQQGVENGIAAITQLLIEAFPAKGSRLNELPDNPVLL